MDFFDCNVSYGMNIASNELRPVRTVQALEKEMLRAGLKKAVAWRVEHAAGNPVVANRLLAEDLRGREDLFGTWSILPTHTHEMPGPEEMLPIMKPSRIVGWRLFPEKCRFLPRAFVLRDWLKVAVQRKVPLFINTAHGTKLEDLAEILQSFPELTVVLTYTHDWPSDRVFRPFVKEFPNVYIDLTFCITDGGIESFFEEYGSSRLLYGSGFPRCYFGGNMLMVRHAGIPLEDRADIAGGNLSRLIAEASL